MLYEYNKYENNSDVTDASYFLKCSGQPEVVACVIIPGEQSECLACELIERGIDETARKNTTTYCLDMHHKSCFGGAF